MRARWDTYIGRFPPGARKILIDADNQVRLFRGNKPGAKQFDHHITSRIVDSAANKVRSLYPENFW